MRHRAGQYTRPHREVVRAKVVLLAAEGETNAEIARRLDVTERCVHKWRRRWCEEGLPGLDEKPRPRPAPVVFPAHRSRRSKRWPASFRPSRVDRCRAGLTLRSRERLSSAGSSARSRAPRSGAICLRDAIRPWAWRSWIFPAIPDFAKKAGRVLDLYERCWQGRRLHPGDYVISADEKSQLQALLGRHDPVAPGPGRRGQRCPYMPPGSIRSRSTSRSCSAKH